MPRRFLIILSIAFLISGCGNPGPDTGKTQAFTIATLKGPSSMGMIRMIDSLKRGSVHKIEVMILNEPIQVRKMMIDGSADFAILPTTMAAIVYNKGMEYRLVAIPVWGTLYLFGSDTTITRWADLRGKKVNLMARGMTPDVLFRYLLQKNGINPENDISLDYTFPTHIDLANAIASGQADLGVISEPLASMAMERNKNLRLIFDLDDEWKKIEGIPITETAFMAKKSVLKNNRQMVEKLLSSYDASTRWVNQNPDSAAALMVKYDILPNSNVAISSIPRSNLNFVRAKDVKSQIEDYLNVFYNMNPDIIGGKIPDEDFIY
ncbi:MAG TPA: ABC transporter substrate-binding protein [Bacteroidales bacterium]|nr:ABC transporter substrate-binding protein [Bacteroidales bacterium]